MFFVKRIARSFRLAVASGFFLAGVALTRAIQLTAGNTVALSVTADGTPPFSYQWLKNAVKIGGATASTYVVSNAQLADTGDYSAIVSNSAGSITAPAETLTIISPTFATNLTATDSPAGTDTTVRSIYAQPLSETTTLGHDAAFTATVVGGNGQWQVSADGSSWNNLTNGGQYSGVTTGTLLINGVTSALDGFKYRFVNGNGTSNAVSLGVIAAFFPFPVGIAADGSGNLYVSDTSTDTVQKISLSGSVTLVAGMSGQAGVTDGSGATARFNDPTGLSSAFDGTLSVCDNANGTLRHVTSDGTVNTVVGSTTKRGNADGSGSAATFSSPLAICQDQTGNLYVADALNNTIRKITPAGVVSTLAGSAGLSGTVDGSGGNARFNHPTGIAVDGGGTVYVADTMNNVIRKITTAGVVSTFAGLAGVSGFQDGIGSGALFNNPSGVATDGSGNVYLTDTGNSTIRKIAPNGVVSTLAGLPGIAGLMDGAGSDAWFNQPKGLVLDSTGNLCVADTGNASIRKITPNGLVSTLALSAGAVTGNVPSASTNNVESTSSSSVGVSNVAGSQTASSGGSSGGGGGAMNFWFTACLFLFGILRCCCNGFPPFCALKSERGS